MVNKQIASTFNLLAALMELHGENAFKTKAYLSTYQSLRKWDRPLSEMTPEEIAAIPGISASSAAKITELLNTGTLEVLEKLKAKTPEGIQQLLQIKGMGPKKIRTIWDSLGVETPAELLYACTENRLVKLPGFGLKTQEDLCVKISYYLDSQHRYLFGVIEPDLASFAEHWRSSFPEHELMWAGEFARKDPVISSIDCIITPPLETQKLSSLSDVSLIEEDEKIFSFRYQDRLIIRCHQASEEECTEAWCRLTMNEKLYEKVSPFIKKDKEDVATVLQSAGMSHLPAELMDAEYADKLQPADWADLIGHKDIRGVVHNHSTWSDGIHTLEEMAVHVRDAGYAYFAICDHSQSAFYANGLQPDRVLQQMEEIDRLNEKLAPFHIFKGIESDILNDGSLDYEADLLSKFDLVVASVHSNLRMDIDRATERLIRAIENPYTRILGHPTSRLLLARPGYPIHYQKVIDACAANGVVMEINANPQRMDIDYTWIPYCQEKGVMLAINPDAHSRGQVGYIRYGVFTARKGLLKKGNCLNTLDLDGFRRWIAQKR